MPADRGVASKQVPLPPGGEEAAPVTSHETNHRGPTAPRGWRPGPLYIVAAAFAIVLVLSWLLFYLPGSARGVDPAPRAPAGPAGPAAPAR